MKCSRRKFVSAAGLAALAAPAAAVAQKPSPQQESHIMTFIDFPEGRWTFRINSSAYSASRTGRDHEEREISRYPDFITVSEHPFANMGDEFRKHYAIPEERAQAVLDHVNREFRWSDTDNGSTGSRLIKYPVETIVERGGDCEDLAILAATLMRASGIQSGLIWLPSVNHVGVGVVGDFGKAPYGDGSGSLYYEHDGTNFFYAEPSSVGTGAAAVQRKIGVNFFGRIPGRVLE